ncbi:MAG: dihydrodipicolinate synthase family protein [Aggregatilineales bacterium]
MQIFKGIWPALVTPANEDHSVNVTVVRNLVDYLIDKDVDGFYIGGTTGEGIFMPVSQRKILTETVLSHVNNRVPVIVHVGAISIDDATDMAKQAQDLGAAGISSIIPPMYDTLNLITRYYKELAASAKDIPFLAYILNPNLDSVALVNSLLDIPNLGGTKYTGPNMFEFRRILDMGNGEWTMFSGMDEQCVYAAMMGATGAIGSTLNCMPGVYRNIRDYIEAGEHDKAQDLQVRANKVIEVMIQQGFDGSLKEVLSQLLGVPFGEPRLPRLPLSTNQRDALHRNLAETDFDTMVAM